MSTGRARQAAWLTVATLLATALLSVTPQAGWSWGDRTHRFINRQAIETLPDGAAAAFYRRHAGELEKRSNDPDTVMRAREGRQEGVRHFINLDAHMEPPFHGFPRFYDAARQRFGKRDLEQRGVLPWVILRFRRQLTDALRRGDESAAVREAAYLGHYVADAYQPLHVTRDYDGQLSGARGIHRRFENGLVDARLDRQRRDLQKRLRRAGRVTDLRDAIFEALFASYGGVAEILRADRLARKGRRVGSAAYYDVLDREVGPLARNQIADAVSMLGDIWLTSWQDAQPASSAPAKRPKEP